MSSSITVKDGTEIYYKDWGTGQPIMFHHGWPLSADDNWWRQGMMGGTKAQYDCIKALSEPTSPKTSRRSPFRCW